MTNLKLITHNNEFIILDVKLAETSLSYTTMVYTYNITNTKEEIFQMWEAAMIKREFDFFVEDIPFDSFKKAYKSNLYKWTDEELTIAITAARIRTELELEQIEELLLMQRIEECFVEVERESPSKSFGVHVERFMTGKTPIKLYPNNSVMVTKIIL